MILLQKKNTANILITRTLAVLFYDRITLIFDCEKPLVVEFAKLALDGQ